MMVRRGRAGTAKPEVIPLPQGIAHVQYNGCLVISPSQCARLPRKDQVSRVFVMGEWEEIHGFRSPGDW